MNQTDDNSSNLSTLQESTALASVFVPLEYRRVNEWPVSQGLVTHDESRVPLCIGPITPGRPFDVPVRLNLDYGLYWAVQQAQIRLSSRHHTDPETVAATTEWNNLQHYCQYWEKVLRQEREERLTHAECYSQYGTSIQLQHSDPDHPRAVIKVAGISDASPPVMRGDIVLIRPLNPLPKLLPTAETQAYWRSLPPVPCRLEVNCRIEEVQRSQGGRVVVTWLHPAQESALFEMYKGSFNIRFVPTIAPLQRILTGLDWLASIQSTSVLSQLLLMENQESTTIPPGPSAPDYLRQVLSKETTSAMTSIAATAVKAFNRLNSDQRAFLNSILSVTSGSRTAPASQPPMPLILTGPAGTGKTGTLLTAIQFLWVENRLQNKTVNRILVCAPSHTASDVITQRLSKFMTSDQLFRLVDPDRPIAAVPTAVLPFCYQSPQTGRFELPADLLRYEAIVCTTHDAHILYRAGVTNQQLRNRRTAFKDYVLEVAGQCGMSAELTCKEPYFTHFFLDEAAQATEPETWIPLSVVLDPGESGVVIALVGDPKQLSPAVYSKAKGLHVSWMERLLDGCILPEKVKIHDFLVDSLNYGRRGTTFLFRSYRCHEGLLCLPSSLFYQDQLQQAKQIDPIDAAFWLEGLRWIEALSVPVDLPYRADIPPEVFPIRTQEWPLHFCGVDGVDKTVTITAGYPSNTWTNAAEASMVSQIVSSLVQQHQVPSQSIGVMAPFRGQVVLIRQLLRLIGLDAINVGTIEDYQAVERRVIVLSLTRATPAFVARDGREGLFGQAKRCNVALTRAENLLIVVGKPAVMWEDAIWRQFLWFCLRNGVYYGHIDQKIIDRWKNAVFHVSRKALNVGRRVDNKEAKFENVIVGSLERMLRNNRL